jgi:hypothetical protein
VIVEFQDFVDEDYMKKQAGVLSSSSRAIWHWTCSHDY